MPAHPKLILIWHLKLWDVKYSAPKVRQLRNENKLVSDLMGKFLEIKNGKGMSDSRSSK